MHSTTNLSQFERSLQCRTDRFPKSHALERLSGFNYRSSECPVRPKPPGGDAEGARHTV